MEVRKALTEPTIVKPFAKCRQVYDQENGVVFTTWATGSAEVDGRKGTHSEFRDRRVRSLEGQMLKELNFLSKLERPIGRCQDECIRRSSPIDVAQSVTNFTLLDITISESTNQSVFLDRLATLRQDQLTTSNEKINGREMLVYRVKGDTLPKSVAIPVQRIAVSNSGFDKGLVNEIRSSFMRLGDKAKYQDESQLVEASAQDSSYGAVEGSVAFIKGW